MNENENINEEIVNPDEVVEVPETVEQQEPPVEEKQEVKEPAPTAEEKTSEEVAEETVEQPQPEEQEEENKKEEPEQVETPEEPTEQEPEPEQKPAKEEQPEEVDDTVNELEELRQKVKNFEDEKEIRTQVEEFVKIKNAKEHEFDNFMATLGENYINTLKKYGIDTTKTIEEITQDDPAKGEIAIKITEQAEQIKQQKAREIANVVDSEYHKVVFTKAEKEFAKFNLTYEQQKAAAGNFVNIVLQLGVQDLGNDITEKVKFAVGRAIMEYPKEAEKVAPATVEEIAQVVEEKANEPANDNNDDDKEEKQEEKQVTDETKEEKENKEEKKEEPPVIPIDEFKEGIVSSGTSVETLSEDNILEVLAKVPFKERTAFYMKHYDMIERAAAKTKIKPNNIR